MVVEKADELRLPVFLHHRNKTRPEACTMKRDASQHDGVQIDPRRRQGRNSFVRDNCHLLAGTVLPEGAVVPPFTVVSMNK